MNRRRRVLSSIGLLFVLGAGLACPLQAVRSGDTPRDPDPHVWSTFLPSDTVFLANAADLAFCQDFSFVLKESPARWTLLTDAGVPEEIREQSMVIIGRFDARYTSGLMQELLSEDQRTQLRQAQSATVLHIASPWSADRQILLASGPDFLLTKQAAEMAMALLTGDETVGKLWQRSSAPSLARQELQSRMEQIQWLASSEELANEPDIETLTVDVNARTKTRMSTSEAAEDVQRLFTLLTHGYCGYGFFQERGDFELARMDILETLSQKKQWATSEMVGLVRESLGFIHDCHLRVGEQNFCDHQDFWYDDRLEFRISDDGFTFIDRGATNVARAVEGGAPEKYLFPSLNRDGDPIYRLGVLSAIEPQPLKLVARGEAGERELDVRLTRSESYQGELFGSRRVGGIPVVRAGGFGDSSYEELTEFRQTASTYRDDPYVVVDLRGNGGGNTSWPKSWISNFTGQTPVLRHAMSELMSRTTRVGRANIFREAAAATRGDNRSRFEAELRQYDAEAARFDSLEQMPYWTSVQIPPNRFIPNDSTLVVLFDGDVASAGEGMLVYLNRQVDNVLFVGENSMGALTFGQVTSHQLPNSKLRVILPVKLNMPMDMELREEIGYQPDLWVPAEDALDATIAAIRKGVISTGRPVPSNYFDDPFKPENSGLRLLQRQLPRMIETALPYLILVCGLVMLYSLRKRAAVLMILAGAWLAVAAVALGRNNAVPAYLFGVLSFVSLTMGVLRLLQLRRASDEPSI